MSKKWWKCAAARALKTVGQTAAASIGTSGVMLHDINWQVILSSSVLAGLLSIITSIAGLPEAKEECKD